MADAHAKRLIQRQETSGNVPAQREAADVLPGTVDGLREGAVRHGIQVFPHYLLEDPVKRPALNAPIVADLFFEAVFVQPLEGELFLDRTQESVSRLVVRRRRLTPRNRSESRCYHADRRPICTLNNSMDEAGAVAALKRPASAQVARLAPLVHPLMAGRGRCAKNSTRSSATSASPTTPAARLEPLLIRSSAGGPSRRRGPGPDSLSTHLNALRRFPISRESPEE